MATAFLSVFTRPVASLTRPPLASCRALCRQQPNRVHGSQTPFSRLYSSTSSKEAVRRSPFSAVRVAGIATVGLGLSTIVNWTPIYCERESVTRYSEGVYRLSVVAGTRPTSPTPPPPPKGATDASGLPPLPPQAESSLNLYELSFGTVCGVCAGVFVKKGAKALAFGLGGIFVLLQVCVSIINRMLTHSHVLSRQRSIWARCPW